MNKRGVCHRDLKLENILLCEQTMQLKIADFGFATSRNVHALNQFRGTESYMAPEILESQSHNRSYDGFQVDVFSAGVILFIIVNGIFPFKVASRNEWYFRLLCDKKYAEYWRATQA